MSNHPPAHMPHAVPCQCSHCKDYVLRTGDTAHWAGRRKETDLLLSPPASWVDSLAVPLLLGILLSCAIVAGLHWWMGQ